MPSSVSYPPAGADPHLRETVPVRSLTFAAALVGASTLVLGVAVYRVQVDNHSPHAWAAATVAVAWAFVLAGLVAWLRRPANRMGPLMLAAGLALLARQFRYSDDALVFTVFFLFGELGYALIGHSILAYPSGRVNGRGARLLVRAGYATVIVFPLAVLLLHDRTSTLIELPGVPRRSLLVVHPDPHAVEVLQKTQIVFFYGVLASLFVAVIVQRLVRATPRARRMLAPLLLAAVALALRAVYECAHVFVDQQPLAYPYLFWWQIAAGIALPLALLAGMLRSRLARAGVGRLVLELDRAPATPRRVRDALARSLYDPSLELFFWLPEQAEFVDDSGVVATLPADDRRRAVTTLDHDGVTVAALVHDPSLLDEPELVESAGAAARLALENAQLHAEARAQLQQVRDSRRRIVSAADEERRRIERNLHDGAQQRLLSLALRLRSAQRRSNGDEGGAIDELLAASVDELQGIVEELRTLARGLHPTMLTEYGLAGALGALTSKAPIPVKLDVCQDRLPAEVEAAGYYVACEALNNVVKHAGADGASISARHDRDALVLEITDDGIGGAAVGDGTGLQGMADRVEALGGRLRVESPAGSGTRVVAEIPCAS